MIVLIYDNEKIYDDMIDMIIIAEIIIHEFVKIFDIELLVENLNNYKKMMIDVIIVIGKMDHEVVKDFDFESFFEGRSSIMKMMTTAKTWTISILSHLTKIKAITWNWW